jgi:hypothetical protein
MAYTHSGFVTASLKHEGSSITASNAVTSTASSSASDSSSTSSIS